MAATMKGAISFGLLHVPVSLHTATQDNDIRFHQLCREDSEQIKMVFTTIHSRGVII